MTSMKHTIAMPLKDSPVHVTNKTTVFCILVQVSLLLTKLWGYDNSISPEVPLTNRKTRPFASQSKVQTRECIQDDTEDQVQQDNDDHKEE